ncbi:MAG: amidase family protein [Deltaproteobacteria bacterium]|nr:amidase family protein [Deltaproteobacteria bacterium]
MRFPEYEQHDATGLAGLIRDGEVSAEEVLEAALERHQALHPRLNALISDLSARARQQARGGLPEGPFRGVPFLFKDLLAWEGHPMTFCANLLRDNVARETHPVVERMLAAGLNVFGRTNSSEMGLLPTTEPALFGATRNPWDLDRSPGGSSGGSAAAVASGIVPAAHANDGGGSIRIPASACGLFGLKPSRGRHSTTTLDPPDGHVVEGAVTRSVRDSAALLDLIHGNRPGDRFWCPPPQGTFLSAVEREPRRLRIAFSDTDFLGQRAHPDCRAAVEDAARLCESLGHEVVEARPAVDGEAYNEAFEVLWSAGPGLIMRTAPIEAKKAGAPEPLLRLLKNRRVLGGALRAFTLKTGKPPLEPFTLRLARLDEVFGPGSVWLAYQTFEAAHRVIAGFLQEYDLTLTPTLGEPPWPTGHFDQTGSIEEMKATLLRYVGYTPFANTGGFPAMSVPLFWSEAGLPIGVHFMGRFGEEELLYSLAGQLERARPWFDRRPPTRA